jgi:hypothetical protein
MCALHGHEGVGLFGEADVKRVDQRLIRGDHSPVLVIGAPLQSLRSSVIVKRARVHLSTHHRHNVGGWVEPQPAIARLSRIHLLSCHPLHRVNEPTAHGKVMQLEYIRQRTVTSARLGAPTVCGGSVPYLVCSIHEPILAAGLPASQENSDKSWDALTCRVEGGYARPDLPR